MATPPVSYGYPGSINAAALATWLPAAAAARFSVVGPDDWKVTVQGGLDRGIRINAGTGCGDGIMDVTAEYETMSLPLVASGSQWFMVVRRRNWATPATTVPVFIAGTAEKKLPARSDTPGQESDQPLALCRVQAGQTIVQEIIDLRCWAGNGGMVAADLLALDYLARPGADVLVGTTPWRYVQGANSIWSWVDTSSSGTTTGFVQAAGWSLVGECRISPFSPTVKRVDMDVNIVRTGASFNMPVKDFTGLGGVIANGARGKSGAVKYLPIAVSGGPLGNNKTAQAYVNTETGQIGFRSNADEWPWVKGAQTTINITYYIPVTPA